MKYVLIIKGNGPGEDRIAIFNNETARQLATLEAIFGNAQVNPDQLEEAESCLKELEEERHLEFEGDPGIQWIDACEVKEIP